MRLPCPCLDFRNIDSLLVNLFLILQFNEWFFYIFAKEIQFYPNACVIKESKIINTKTYTVMKKRLLLLGCFSLLLIGPGAFASNEEHGGFGTTKKPFSLNADEYFNLTPTEDYSDFMNMDAAKKRKKKKSSGRRGSSANEKSIGIALDLGTVVALGELSNSYIFGFQFGLNANLFLMEEKLGIGMGYAYNTLIGQSSFASTDGESISISSGTIHSIYASGRYIFMPDRVFRPYVGLNLGVYIYDIVASTPLDNEGSIFGLSLGETAVTPLTGASFGFSPRLGFWVGRTVSFGLEIGYDWGAPISYTYDLESTYDYENDVAIPGGTRTGKVGMNGLVFKIGLMYKFGI